MEEKTDILNEQTVNEIETTSLNESEPANDVVFTTAKQEEKPSGGSNVVTKKFLTIALAITILINAGVTAGVTMLTAKYNSSGRQNENNEMISRDRPGGNGQDGKGQMAPPQDGQNNGQDTSESDDTDNT